MFNRSVKCSQNVRISTAGDWEGRWRGETEIDSREFQERKFCAFAKFSTHTTACTGKYYVTRVPSHELGELRIQWIHLPRGLEFSNC